MTMTMSLAMTLTILQKHDLVSGWLGRQMLLACMTLWLAIAIALEGGVGTPLSC